MVWYLSVTLFCQTCFPKPLTIIIPGVKALKCPLCDYSTNDKSNFRRHRRLHMGNNPVSVLKCGKCSFSTIMIRKFKEHCSQVHNEDLNSVPYSHSSHPTFPHQAYGDGVDRHFAINPPLDLHHVNHPHHAPPTNNFSASNALHSLLTGIHPTPQLYRRQTYPAQSLNQYGGYLPPHATFKRGEPHGFKLPTLNCVVYHEHPSPRSDSPE